MAAENTVTFIQSGRSTSYSGMPEFRRTERLVTRTVPPTGPEPPAREPPQYSGFRRTLQALPLVGLLF